MATYGAPSTYSTGSTYGLGSLWIAPACSTYSTSATYSTTSTYGACGLTGQAAAARARLAAQYWDSANLIKLISIFAVRWQPILNVLAVLKLAWRLSTATGTQLDAIGERVDLDRQGLDDDAYRIDLAIKAKQVLPTQATAPQILEIARALVGDDRAIKFVDYPPAGFLLQIADMTAGEIERFPRFLGDSKGGGILATIGVLADSALIVDYMPTDPVDAPTKVGSSTGSIEPAQLGNVSSTIKI